MDKTCACGGEMLFRLRTVIFAKIVTIDNVPVYSCDGCGHSEVIPEVKHELSALLERLGAISEKQHISFNEANELAFLLVEASRKERFNEPIEQMARDRINQLLDVLLLATSLNDAAWKDELHERLSQLTRGLSIHTS